MAIIFTGYTDSNEQSKILGAINEISEKGDGFSQRLAKTLLRSKVTFNAQPQANVGASGTTAITDPRGAKAHIATGNLTVEQALAYISINISEEEFNHLKFGDATLHGLIVHEGTHALTYAAILSSLTASDPRRHQTESYSNSEFRAKAAAATYLLYRGNRFTDLAIALGQINRRRMVVDVPAIKQQTAGQKGNLLDDVKKQLASV